MTNTHYIIVPQGSHLSPAFAIRDTRTGFIVAHGFTTIASAEAYITENAHIGGYPDDPTFDY
jgi:acyl dehydratase